MIDVTTFGQNIPPASRTVSIDIDKIALVQEQEGAVIGQKFTAIFMVGIPPYQVTESREEVKKRILEARALRVRMASSSVTLGKLGI